MARRKTHEEFLAELPDLPVEVLGKYVNAKTKLLVRCLDCGREWESWPVNLRRGFCCAPCGQINRDDYPVNRILWMSGESCAVDISTRSFRCAYMLIDIADWDMLLKMNIGRVVPNKHGYAVCRMRGRGSIVLLHRLLLAEAEYVDHVNGDGLDNRRKNIRPCTQSENGFNSGLSINNTSGFKGVYRQKRDGRYVAKIMVNRREIHLGMFNCLEDAIAARVEADEKYCGEFARKL